MWEFSQNGGEWWGWGGVQPIPTTLFRLTYLLLIGLRGPIQTTRGENGKIIIIIMLEKLVMLMTLMKMVWFEVINDSHFHLFSLLILNPHFASLKLTARKGQQTQVFLS